MSEIWLDQVTQTCTGHSLGHFAGFFFLISSPFHAHPKGIFPPNTGEITTKFCLLEYFDYELEVTGGYKEVMVSESYTYDFTAVLTISMRPVQDQTTENSSMQRGGGYFSPS